METNSVSGGVTGPVVQVGVHHGDLNIHSPGPVRSRYLAQVERIAPPDLVDRDEELAELARFCTSPGTEGRYVWWRAEAWSGKSALLSTFVLNPPPAVRVISFFVTASLARHSDRQAFVDSLLEQLCALLEEPPLAHLTESTRETQLLGLLSDAAQRCRDRGEHLVLVVDGLDEDRGIDGTPDARSIAALLPVNPPAGLRIVVSGRPDPPVPADVPDHHPLHDPAIVRALAPSARAHTVRHAMEGDLKRLLAGSRTDQDLLGLLAAACGGLTTPDLAELLELSEWQVDDHLRTAAGRSFARRAGDRPGQLPDVHLFAHEQLLATARSMLGKRLTGYRNRLHTWAGAYAALGWPPDTPEYLFRGYFTMLLAARDVDRMLACATDPDRQRNLRTRTGGDGAALAEITATQSLVFAEAQPNLVALARLAVHRVHLHRSNSSMPAALPACWARLGHVGRAESMVEAIHDPVQRLNALLAAARAFRECGETYRADIMLDKAEEQAALFDPFWNTPPFRAVAQEYGRIGDDDRAKRLIGRISSSRGRMKALAWLAIGSAAGGDPSRARQYLADAESVLESQDHTLADDALAVLAAAAAEIGEPARAASLLDQVETIQQTTGNLGWFELTAQCAAIAGEYDRALRMTAMIDDPDERERSMLTVLRVTAGRDPDRAETMARTTAEAIRLCPRLATVARAVLAQDSDRAARLTAEADRIAHLDAAQRLEALIAVAAAIADLGDIERAAAIARDYAESGTDAEKVLDVALAAIRANDPERGEELLVLAELVARKAVDRDVYPSVLWIRTMAGFRDFDRATRLAASFADRTARSAAWAALAESALAAEELEVAERALAAIEEPPFQRRTRLDLVHARSAAGDVARAAAIARGAADRESRTSALLLIARVARSDDVFDEVTRIAGSLPDPDQQMAVLVAALEHAAEARLRERAAGLLAHLKPIARHILDNPLTSDTNSYLELNAHREVAAQQILRLCSSGGRTLTEIAEVAADLQSPKPLLSKLDPFAVYTDKLEFTAPPPDPPPGKELAQKLVDGDWREVSAELVEQCPDAYPAILAELDKLEAS